MATVIGATCHPDYPSLRLIIDLHHDHILVPSTRRPKCKSFFASAYTSPSTTIAERIKDMGKGLCELCQHLDLESLTHVELPRSHPITYVLGLLSTISDKRLECDFCQLVISTISAAWKQPLPTTTINGHPVTCSLRNRAVGVISDGEDPPRYSENFAANSYRYSNCRITISCDKAPIGCPRTAEIQLAGEKLDIRGLFDDVALFSRRPQTKLLQANFPLAKQWFTYCRHSHGDVCKRDALPQNHMDNYVSTFRLIDVWRSCIADAEADSHYVALSYVWGQSPMLQLVQSNKSMLYTDGALVPDHQSIPQTIRDAMLTVKNLGEQYLWVDALCIVQDDKLEKAKVIGEMDLIYSRAELTLVAAFGSNAEAGLPGVQPGTRDVDAFEAKASFRVMEEHTELIVARSRPTTIIDASKWNNRGWTYQERLFSCRMLIFTDEQMLYWCGKSSWCEDTVLETDDEDVHLEDAPLSRFSIRNDPSAPFMRQVEEVSKTSMFEEYSKIITEFSRRDLSFEGDILDAFAGLLRSFKSSYKPNPDPLQYYFGLPSAWFELSLLWTPLTNSPAIRRRNATYHDTSGEDVPFPSWSWTGWVGKIHYQYPQMLEARTRSELKWYTFNGAGSVSLLKTGGDSTHPLPPWFQSSSEPRLLRDKWKPLGASVDVQAAEIHDLGVNPRTHLLMFHTSSVFMPIIERRDGLQAPGSENSPVREYFIAGEGQGFIDLDAEWVAGNPGPFYEFIVISRTMGDDWRAPGMCDSLNVMLIERHGQETYRVGVGSVAESTWVLYEPQWKFIQLG